MNYFSARLIALLVVAVPAAAGAGWCAARGMTAPGVALLGAAIVAAAAVLTLTGRLKGLLRTFLLSLEAGDSTVSVDIRGDHDMQAISGAMNRIADLYGQTMLELTTRKMYYDRILRVMTHEIRNDLAPVIALSSEMAGHPASYSPDDTAEAMQLIHAQSTRLKGFLDSYYDLTHIPAPDITDVDVHEFLSRIIRRQQAARSQRVAPDTLSVIVPVGLKGRFDPDLVGRALDNVIRNALEAAAHNDKPGVTLTATASGNELHFTVRDNGPGFTAEARENLFLPFYTTKPGGSGIGLAISRQIARLHRGDLTVMSMPGRWTAVTLTLPQ